MQNSTDKLTTSQAAQLLRVSPSTLKRWAEAGNVPSERTSGGHRRFQRRDLEDFTAAHSAPSDDPARWANALLNAEAGLSTCRRVCSTRACGLDRGGA